jgi:hypothetical protein
MESPRKWLPEYDYSTVLVYFKLTATISVEFHIAGD